jgi:hypothetical protein
VWVCVSWFFTKRKIAKAPSKIEGIERERERERENNLQHSFRFFCACCEREMSRSLFFCFFFFFSCVSGWREKERTLILRA